MMKLYLVLTVLATVGAAPSESDPASSPSAGVSGVSGVSSSRGGGERMLFNGPKVLIKSAALSSRKRSDLHEIYLAPYRYIEKEILAIAVLTGQDRVSGVVSLSQSKPPAGLVTLRGTISGLKPGKHSIHINRSGDLRNNCRSTGKFYNPYNLSNGVPYYYIQANQDGQAEFTITDKLLTLSGSRSLIGRSVVVDENVDVADDSAVEVPGSPVACGVIGRTD